MIRVQVLAEVERGPSLQNLVDLEHAVVEHQLFYAEALALVRQDPGWGQPAHLGNSPCCSILQNLQTL